MAISGFLSQSQIPDRFGGDSGEEVKPEAVYAEVVLNEVLDF